MRAHTITTSSRSGMNLWRRSFTLAVVTATLAIPASASGELPTPDTYLAQQGSSSSRLSSNDGVTTPDTYLQQEGAGVNTPTPSGPELESGSPASSDDGFDWLSATIGAGVALLAIGAAAYLVMRRRPAVTPVSTA
jgi:hypothetical protein